MNELYLIEPNKEYQKSFESYALAYKIIHDELYYCIYQQALENFNDYITILQNYANGVDLPQGDVATSNFWLITQNEVVGVVRVRHEESGTAGHIGYDISPAYRNNGYGNTILKLALVKAKELGLTEIVVTCNVDNAASRKIIENSNGRFICTIYDEEEDEYLDKFLIVNKL